MATKSDPTLKKPARLFTLVQVALLLSVSRRTLNAWIEAGRLPIVRIGPRLPRVLETDLETFIARHREGGDVR